MIKHIRKMKGFTQEELGEILGLSQAQISKIENGEFIEFLTIEKVVKLADLLGICPTALMCRLINEIKVCNIAYGEINYSECLLIKKHHKFLNERLDEISNK